MSEHSWKPANPYGWVLDREKAEGWNAGAEAMARAMIAHIEEIARWDKHDDLNISHRARAMIAQIEALAWWDKECDLNISHQEWDRIKREAGIE